MNQEWVEGRDIDVEYILTADGITVVEDIITVAGYADTGEAIIQPVQTEGSSLGARLVDLAEFDISGLPVSSFVGMLSEGLPSDLVFSAGAKAFATKIAVEADTYRFDCYDGWDQWFEENLECDNTVVLGWSEEDAANVKAPVLATSLDNVVYMEQELTAASMMMGKIHIGRGYGPMGEFEISAMIVSEDGSTTAATGLMVKYFKTGLNIPEPESIAAGDAVLATVGDIPVLELPSRVKLLKCWIATRIKQVSYL